MEISIAETVLEKKKRHCYIVELSDIGKIKVPANIKEGAWKDYGNQSYFEGVRQTSILLIIKTTQIMAAEIDYALPESAFKDVWFESDKIGFNGSESVII